MQLKSAIDNIKARQILTSRGEPTVEVDFVLQTGVIRSSVPSGASVGRNEALVELDHAGRYGGLGVSKIVDRINSSRDEILETSADTLADFDRKMMRLCTAANFLLPISACFYKLITRREELKSMLPTIGNNGPASRMPIPFFNVINGGLHSGNGFWCQEILVTFGEQGFAQNLESAVAFYKALRSVIGEKYGLVFTSVADEGGFAPPVHTVEECMGLLESASQKAGIPDYRIGFDCAANTFYLNGRYNINMEEKGATALTGAELGEYYSALTCKYPRICSIEDPFAEEDIASWDLFYSTIKPNINIVADDLTVTNPDLILKYARDSMQITNTILIKPNQIGTISKTLEAIKAARTAGCKVMLSHRSGETEDTLVAQLAVDVGADYIKCGAPCRGERICKYNELLRIEESANE